MKPSAVLSVLALAAFTLAACASGQSGSVTPQETPRPGATATQGASPANRGQEAGPSVRWRATMEGDVVIVEVQDRNNAYRVERVELIAPDGRIVQYANDITRERLTPGGRWTDSSTGLGVGVGGSGGSRSGAGVGVLFDIPIGGSRGGDSPDAEARTTARLPLGANAAAYRAAPGQWRLRIAFSDRAGSPSNAVIPAPTPGS